MVVAGAIGDALVDSQLESTVVVLKHPCTDRGSGGEVDVDAFNKLSKETADWNQDAHAAAKEGIFAFSSGESDL